MKFQRWRDVKRDGTNANGTKIRRPHPQGLLGFHGKRKEGPWGRGIGNHHRQTRLTTASKQKYKDLLIVSLNKPVLQAETTCLKEHNIVYLNRIPAFPHSAYVLVC